MRIAAAITGFAVLAVLFLTACQGPPHVAGGVPTLPPCLQAVPPPPPPAPEPPPPPPEPAPDPRDLALQRVHHVRIYFDFDSALLTAKAQAILDQVAGVLTAWPDIRVELQGYCDERGSEEYNRALGLRRAHSGKAYLVEKGATPEQILVSTGGEENPLLQGDTEDAFAKNR
ncbi:MAG: OmpA family protein, partial [Pseudomonadota bacterium]